MRKAITIVGAIVGLVVLIVGGVLLYAARNLNSIIAEREDFILQRVSDALDRKVEVASINVTLGWGLEADLSGLKIEDDPALSDQPFVFTKDAYAKVELIPLLSRKVHVTEVTLKNPEVRIIRTEEGELNIAGIGKKRSSVEEPAPAATPSDKKLQGAPITSEHTARPAGGKRADLAAIYIRSLTIDDGVIVYEERGRNHQTFRISDFDLTVDRFSFMRVFDLHLKLAMLAEKQNIDVSGRIGPLVQEGKLDIRNPHFSLEAKVGPLELSRLRAIGSLGKSIPEALSVPDPISFAAHADGTPADLKFHFDTDLTAVRVAWAQSFDKPASVPLVVNAEGTRSDAGLQIGVAKTKLDDLNATLRDIRLATNNLSGHIDTNRFDIAAMAKMIPALQKYNPSGHLDIHSDVQVADRQPRGHGTITLAEVAVSRPDDQKILVSGLTGDIKLDGNAGDVGPLKFNLAGGHATASVHADSLQPLSATYTISIDNLNVQEFAPKRPADEHVTNLAMNGTIAQHPDLAAKVKATSSEGDLANIAYKDLAMSATLLGKQLNLESMKVGAFNGAVEASGTAMLTNAPEFALNLATTNVDIQSALQSQNSKSADLIRGILDAQLQVSGKGANLAAIKPTLAGNGRAHVHDGKLVGINLATEALKKTNGLPGIGDLIPPSVVERHPELFNNPDTDIQSAGLTFVLEGTRITSHDIAMQTPDYGMSGDGWFDMDKNIEMNSHVVLTPQLSKEIIAEKHNVVYLTNRDREVDVPMMVRGKLPKPTVFPDLAELAQRASSHLLEEQGKNLGKLLKKGKGLNLPFLNNGGGSSKGGNSNPSGNPLDQLKGLFH
ncbi:MAG TPA: AsmA-like C-terminal region-containing protein [Candidatus Binataceae bacterium]|nr:AsmA-like C-terminal region-containing protein [Candidatus Binataceae bacterium]